MDMLENKVAVVTGAATGIGEAVARLFAAEGAKVFLFDRDRERNEATARSIEEESGFAQADAVDVCDPAAVTAAIGRVVERFGRIDALVNNAGIYPRKRFVDMTEAEWDNMQDVNVKSMFYCTKAVAPGMISRRNPGISSTSHL